MTDEEFQEKLKAVLGQDIKDEFIRRAKSIVASHGGFSERVNNITTVGDFWVIAHMTGRIDVRYSDRHDAHGSGPTSLVFRIDPKGNHTIDSVGAVEALEAMRRFMVLEDLADI